MTFRQVRLVKTKTDRMINKIVDYFRRNQGPEVVPVGPYAQQINTGDLVRVKSEASIKATLDHWGILKGCMFMPEMAKYCGTNQRVFRRMERFVDERDYHVKQSHGIILLEGLHCQGTSHYGRCDRACFYFWREEWLEKSDQE
jgi:hypothetical protein